MAGSVNKVIILGHLGRDPEVKLFDGGGKVVNLSIATSQRWKDKNTGEQRERTEWHRVSVFATYACNYAERFLRKGSLVYVEGALETRKWQDQAGQDRYATDITIRPYGGQLLGLDKATGDGRRAADDGPQQGERGGPPDDRDLSGYGSGQSGGDSAGGDGYSDMDDEIPF